MLLFLFTVNEPNFKAGLASVCLLLNIPEHYDPVTTLEAVSVLIQERLMQGGAVTADEVGVFLRRFQTLDTIGNCQRPVFSLGVSQHKHKITNPVKKFSLKLRYNNERKIPFLHEVCAFSCLILRLQNLILRSRIKFVEKYFFLQKTLSLQRKPFLTMFYTINLSPLLISK